MDNRTHTAEASTVLMRAENPDRAILIAILLSTGLWDHLPIADRQAWLERGEVLNTPGGRLLAATLQRAEA